MFYKLKESAKHTDELIWKVKQEEQISLQNSKKEEILKLKKELDVLKADNQKLEESEKKVN